MLTKYFAKRCLNFSFPLFVLSLVLPKLELTLLRKLKVEWKCLLNVYSDPTVKGELLQLLHIAAWLVGAFVLETTFPRGRL